MASVLRALTWAENALITVLAVALIALAGTQIAARVFFETSFIWIDALSRSLVLWLAMLGAVVAAREAKHLGIDLFVHALPLFWQQATRMLSALFTISVCGVLAYAAWGLVALEFEMSSGSNHLLPGWLNFAILPIGFGLMGVHVALRLLQPTAANS